MKWVVSVVTNLLPRDLRTVSAHELNQISLSTKQKAAKAQRHRYLSVTFLYSLRSQLSGKATYILKSLLNLPPTTQPLTSSKTIYLFFFFFSFLLLPPVLLKLRGNRFENVPTSVTEYVP